MKALGGVSGDAAVVVRAHPVTAIAGGGPDSFALSTTGGHVELLRVEPAPATQWTLGRSPRVTAVPLSEAAVDDAAALAVVSAGTTDLAVTVNHRGAVDVTGLGEEPVTTRLALPPAADAGPPAVAACATPQRLHVVTTAGNRVVAAAVTLPLEAGERSPDAVARHEHTAVVTAVDVLVDEESALVVVGDDEGGLAVLDWQQALITCWRSPRPAAPVRCLAAWRSPSGQRLFAAAHADGGGALWSLEQTPDHVTVTRRSTLSGLPAAPCALAAGPGRSGCRLLAVAGADAVRVWDLGSDRHVTVQMEEVTGVVLARPADADAVAVLATRNGQVVLRQLDGTGPWFSKAAAVPTGGRSRDGLVVRAAADQPYTGDGQDHLHFGRYADALALLLEDEHTGTPLTVAIDGPWGSGKTSLGRMVQRRLTREQPLAAARRSSAVAPPPITCWFDAWMNDGGERLSAALASAIVKAADGHRPWWQRLLRPIDGRLLDPGARRRRRLRLALLWPLAAGLVVAVALAVAPEILPWIGQALGVDGDSPTVLAVGGASLTLGLLRALPLALARAGATVAQFVRRPVALTDSGSVAQVRAELGELIAAATAARPAPPPASAGRVRRWWERRLDAISRRRLLAATLGRLMALRPARRFVLFVDNLDRCRPERAVDACETLNQLLDHEGVGTVLMVDLHALAVAAEITFADVAERVFPEAKGEGWGRAFLEKLVQFDFTLPAPTPESIQSVFHANAGADGRGGQR